MAGITGPIPNRSDQRVRRNKVDIDKVPVIGSVRVPKLDIENPHPLVTDMYDSLKDSAQAKYYEPSDWQHARLTMYLMNDMLQKPKISAMMLSSVIQMMTPLLMTEGDRRRVRMEVERTPSGPGAEVVSIADVYRQRLDG